MSACEVYEDVIEFDASQQWLGLIIFVAEIVVIPITIVWWMTRSNHPLLAKRHFGLMVVSAFGILLQAIASGLTNYIGRDAFPCDLTLWLTLFYLPLACGPVATRLVLTTYRIRFGKLILEDVYEESEDFDPELYRTGSLAAVLRSFFRTLCSCTCESIHDINQMHTPNLMNQSNRRIYSRRLDLATVSPTAFQLSTATLDTTTSAGRPRRASRTQAIFFGKSNAFGIALQVLVTAITLFIGIGLSVAAETNFGFRGCYGCVVEGQPFVAYVSLGCLMLIIIAPTSIILWKTDDPIGIVHELRVVVILGLVVFIGTLLSIPDPGGVREHGKFDWLYIVALASFGVHLTQCVYPIFLTYRENSHKHGRRKDSTTLSMILESPGAKRIFQAYLAQEWSSENGVFLDAISRYRVRHNDLPTRDLVSRIVDIYATFIKDGSMLEVNLPSSIKSDLESKVLPLQALLESNAKELDIMPKPPLELFDRAYEEVYELVETDSFPRFQRSHLYKHAKASLSSRSEHSGP
ncbi:Regulator of G-protein signaling 1 [Hondaea fermentalgiana]|uniref:Regulator of G-protein signaling 1 n=1 Tax=Hondaea fermentalgiana TaxID=2315210 RepID=A0A2R5GH44_9STRA|nr:Regulator of G-protein signaling 1 [Hondaea fermentalgiana]|eukprot:GBG30212.1 Regulator of G-protein signaling 1 [Hondaea fermentalgiana]